MSRALLALLLALACAGGITASGADSFTASSSSTGTLTAAADFNTVAVSLDALSSPLSGSVPVAATATSDRGIASVKFQSAPHGTSNWVDICTDTTASYGCSWDTTLRSDGRYDVRAVATDNTGHTRTSTITDRTLDNFTFTVSLADPGANISGTKTLTATAAGAADGLTSLKIQQRTPGAPTWTDVCTKTASPASCPFDTTQFPDGGRELRAVATDGSGATATSSLRTPNIDNSPPTNTPSIPTTGTGTVSMTADAVDTGSGIQYVSFEAQYAGVWYEFCHLTTAPYTCSGDSAQVPDGTYLVRVTVKNNAGVITTSTPTSITIDNTPPAPTGLQTSNAGTAGLLESGDTVTLTWSEKIAPASVLAGWNGTGQAIRVRVTDSTTNDQMAFWDATGTTRLNLTGAAADLKLGGDFVSSAAEFDATMLQSGSSITVTLGSQTSGSAPLTAVAGTMIWTPSSGAKDLAGNASRTTAFNEPAPLDLDF